MRKQHRHLTNFVGERFFQIRCVCLHVSRWSSRMSRTFSAPTPLDCQTLAKYEGKRRKREAAARLVQLKALRVKSCTNDPQDAAVKQKAPNNAGALSFIRSRSL
jgi:hypothetical protein